MANGSARVDEVWELIRETRIDMRRFHAGMEELRASQKEFGEGMEELRASQKEFGEGMEELRASQKETAKQLKQTDSRFNTQWGRLVESLVEGSLVALLQARGIEVHQTSTNAKVQFVGDGGELRRKEFDILAVNGAEVVAVEVKTTLTPGKVRYFLSAMEDFKRYFPYFGDKAVYGAMAYLRNDSEAALYAERQGLLVVRATGDGASIVNAPDFTPKVFPSRGAGG